ncbi:hypothetical protein D9758_008723 [Tetrapyrgos nigripes]|uniref:Uncharacterized protein n=1 Tax=Tetrapyrgos nigripes TaxID=182062 RepID=A0A8H5D3S2_9AGAR|nr:hypothetical protein D9758_008723 [Tetrapyrgos nigripes]
MGWPSHYRCQFIPQILVMLVVLLIAVTASPIHPRYHSDDSNSNSTVPLRLRNDADTLTTAITNANWGPSLAATVIDPILYPQTGNKDPQTRKARTGELVGIIGKDLKSGLSVKTLGGLVKVIVEAGVKMVRD